jgi:hypothetical protein
MHKHRLLPLAALCACALGAIAAPAQAAKPAKFTATFEAQRTVKWNEPRWQPPSSCYRVHYEYGSGGETWKVKSRPTKILVSRGYKGVPMVRIGTWNEREPTVQIGLEASGIQSRANDVFSGWNPGSCGGVPGTDPPRVTDCGTRLPKHIVLPQFAARTLTPDVIDAPDNMAPGFGKCALNQPGKIAEAWTRVPGKYSLSKLLSARRKPVQITGKDKWNDKGFLPNGGLLNRSAQVSWTLTLEPAK